MEGGDVRNKFLFWAPRIIIGIFSVFIFVLALFSGVDEDTNVLSNLPNTLPWLLLFGLVWFAWNYERAGGLLLLVFGGLSVSFFETWVSLITFGIVSFPILLAGALFLLNYYLNKH